MDITSDKNQDKDIGNMLTFGPDISVVQMTRLEFGNLFGFVGVSVVIEFSEQHVANLLLWFTKKDDKMKIMAIVLAYLIHEQFDKKNAPALYRVN
ncbi:Octicosapeptide/Phox/Bem1p family protein [Prunus dulcis]|uniref:Octicosapeptide/Phox/Bem1p family protein n=1 Tax=Prunus dulcis TaxID=3755 RepID=A0A4Y1QVQ2_PRUDU|nr:Octicosapeptide/Phox/Bem1p family protein [Prunus dulcis]